MHLSQIRPHRQFLVGHTHLHVVGIPIHADRRGDVIQVIFPTAGQIGFQAHDVGDAGENRKSLIGILAAPRGGIGADIAVRIWLDTFPF
jgi:hypothetical protein